MIDAGGPASGVMIVVAFVLYAVLAAGLLVVNMPPYQNADETNHFLRADSIARGHLLGQRIANGTDFGGLAAPEIARSGAAFDWPKFHPERKVTVTEYASAAGKFGAPEAEITFPNTAVYPPTLYLPSVAATWIGKVSRASVVQTLYLARLLTAVLSGLAIGIALCRCVARGADGAALGLFVVATLPMALSLQSAVSQDGPMLGLAALTAAFMVQVRQAASTGALIGLCACISLLAMARPPYVILALLPLAACGGWLPRATASVVVVMTCLSWSLLVSRTAPLLASMPNADISVQAGILLHPGRVVSLLINTLNATGWSYVEQFIGRLGWLDVALPGWYVSSTFYGLLACLILIVRPFDWRGLLVGTAVAASAVAVMLLIYLSWTAVGRPVIDGVQGRYFLPLAMVLCGLGAALPRSAVFVPVRLGLLLWPAVSIAVTMRAVVVRYYLSE